MQADEESQRCLIVGLGNPGTEYEKTRHNLGFKVVQEFARKQGWLFKRELRFKGKLAQGMYREKNLFLLLPSTYMNLSGLSVRKVVDYYRIPFGQEKSFLVVVDDVYLKFGAMRLRPHGSAGGHNGLKSVEQELRSQSYARLRVGVGPGKEQELSEGQTILLKDYVLGAFTNEEQKQLPQIVADGVAVIESWLQWGVETAMQTAGELSTKRI